MATELHVTEAGYERSYQQCRDKIKKLRGEYKKKWMSTTKQVKGGVTRSTLMPWILFLGSKPATKPSVVIDTLDTAAPSITAVANSEQEPQDDTETEESASPLE